MFKHVAVSFLPIEHRHQNIDQALSKTPEWLRITDAVTYDDLHSQLRTTYAELSSAIKLKSAGNRSGISVNEQWQKNPPKLSHFRHFISTAMQIADG